MFLDVRGTSKLHGGAAGLFAAIRAAIAPVEPLGIGLAANRFTAEAAARATCRHPVTVAAGDEAAFLAGQPLGVLPMSAALRRRLAPLGLATLGEIAAIPVDAFERRYGPEGLVVHRLARGEDSATLTAWDPQRCPSVHRELAGPVERLDRLDDDLRDALARLCEVLEQRGQGLTRLSARWQLESGAQARHEVVPAAPERRVGLLRDMLALSLEADPPGERIVAFELEATDVQAEAVHQNALFGEVERDASRRVEALSRLEALLGAGVVTRPRLRAAHRLEERWVDEPGGSRGRPREVPAAPRHEVLRVGEDVTDGAQDGAGPTLRMFAEPEELVPMVQGGQLVAFRRGRDSLEVARLTGLRRLEGGWWSARPWARDEYDLYTPDRAWYRICRDMHRRRWLLLGQAD